MTGAGGANPFRASMFNNLGSGSGAGTSLGGGLGASGAGIGSGLGSGLGASVGTNPFPSSASGLMNVTSPFGGQAGATAGLGASSPFGSGQAGQQQQQQHSFSLI